MQIENFKVLEKIDTRFSQAGQFIKKQPFMFISKSKKIIKWVKLQR